jgi:hypothetical protein
MVLPLWKLILKKLQPIVLLQKQTRSIETLNKISFGSRTVPSTILILLTAQLKI